MKAPKKKTSKLPEKIGLEMTYDKRLDGMAKRFLPIAKYAEFNRLIHTLKTNNIAS